MAMPCSSQSIQKSLPAPFSTVDSLGGARIVDEIYAGAEGVCLDEPNVSKGLTEIEKTWV